MLNALILFLLTIGTLINSEAFKIFIARIVTILSMAFVWCVMFFELIDVHATEMTNEKSCDLAGTSYSYVVVNLHGWFDLHQGMIHQIINPYIGYVLAVTVFFAIKARQKTKCQETGEEAPKVVFEDVNRLGADKTFRNLMKFIINYGFYKFGYEVTLCMFVVVIYTHNNILTLPYIIWFIILLFYDREKASTLWKIAKFFVFASVTVQVLVLAVFVVIKPCAKADVEQVVIEIVALLYEALQDDHNRPEKMVADFLLLMLLTLQV